MNVYQKIIIAIILCVIGYRYVMTISISSEGIHKTSPDQSMIADINEHGVQYFFGGNNRYSTITIKNQNGEYIKKVKYEHEDKYYNWYSEGKINWISNQKLEFTLKNKTLIILNLEEP